MDRGSYNLAIETSGREGSLTLGRGGERLESQTLVQARRHNVELMPAIAALCGKYGVTPGQLGEVYVSVGPGSFTGLRVGVATAKMLGLTLGARLVAVPTLEVVAGNVPVEMGQAGGNLLVCLNLKRETVYAGFFAVEEGRWVRQGEPRLATVAQLLEEGKRLVGVVGEGLEILGAEGGSGPRVLSLEFAAGKSESVWRIGRRLAEAGAYVSAEELLPLYVRPPEAEEVWKRRQAEAGRG
ncbi:MAG: tRNA (adenosine(37)-N6)-threonylcarbamoyltransferase complex dimerization subunit type 1 TsaB [Phycisphaeraceae bacterium]|nr:tRNA (adenosine(37)-N6)-threonylcarbamoyltransferase complex dimerization subunit type 1 TsaB [Phycisphaeraceae bacterium]